MVYNITKLVVIAGLIVFGIVAIGLEWVDEQYGWAFIMGLVGYIIGNASLLDIPPIVERPLPNPESPPEFP